MTGGQHWTPKLIIYGVLMFSRRYLTQVAMHPGVAPQPNGWKISSKRGICPTDGLGHIVKSRLRSMSKLIDLLLISPLSVSLPCEWKHSCLWCHQWQVATAARACQHTACPGCVTILTMVSLPVALSHHVCGVRSSDSKHTQLQLQPNLTVPPAMAE